MMAKLMYLKEVNPDTFLHYSVSGSRTCLRDYSRGLYNPPEENRHHTREAIQEFLLNTSIQVHDGSNSHRADDTTFWHREIAELNDKHGLTGTQTPTRFARLLDQIHDDVAMRLNDSDPQGLKKHLEATLLPGLSVIAPKKGKFNRHDDHDPAKLPNTFTKGIHWTSCWLAESRRAEMLHFMKSGDSTLDFSLLAQEINLEISRTKNPFHQGKPDSLNLDGLGIRQDGSLCVVEVKGPRDTVQSAVRALIQAFAGGLAVYAKRTMICELARTKANKRPAASNVCLPENRRTMGLYVMVDQPQLPCDTELKTICHVLYGAFAALRDIAFFDIGGTGNSARFILKKVYREGGLCSVPTDGESAS